MIEELLLWLWLFLRVSGFVQQNHQLGTSNPVVGFVFVVLFICIKLLCPAASIRRPVMVGVSCNKKEISWVAKTYL